MDAVPMASAQGSCVVDIAMSAIVWWCSREFIPGMPFDVGAGVAVVLRAALFARLLAWNQSHAAPRGVPGP